MASNLKLAYWDFEATLSYEKSFVISLLGGSTTPCRPHVLGSLKKVVFLSSVFVFVFVIFLRKGTITQCNDWLRLVPDAPTDVRGLCTSMHRPAGPCNPCLAMTVRVFIVIRPGSVSVHPPPPS